MKKVYGGNLHKIICNVISLLGLITIINHIIIFIFNKDILLFYLNIIMTSLLTLLVFICGFYNTNYIKKIVIFCLFLTGLLSSYSLMFNTPSTIFILLGFLLYWIYEFKKIKLVITIVLMLDLLVITLQSNLDELIRLAGFIIIFTWLGNYLLKNIIIIDIKRKIELSLQQKDKNIIQLNNYIKDLKDLLQIKNLEVSKKNIHIKLLKNNINDLIDIIEKDSNLLLIIKNQLQIKKNKNYIEANK